ncbi:MAG: thiamine ABC transporter substrate-binding protein, partial [Pseudomonadota bacterium]
MRTTINHAFGKTLTLGCALAALAAGPVVAQNNTLTVYTYESFVAEWGPGPQVEAAFEAKCDCDV